MIVPRSHCCSFFAHHQTIRWSFVEGAPTSDDMTVVGVRYVLRSGFRVIVAREGGR
ncbi:MAG: hypothetical protein JNM09_06185 [Blastocatellia bacterium]|nr:hypothetical protein [Blastocatellia bacterium]